MQVMKNSTRWRGAALLLAFGIMASGNAHAIPAASAPASVDAGRPAIQQARSFLQKFADALGSDDDDGFVHDDHYDWQAYRDSTSRKDRIRDYQRMQNEMQKDAFRAQKNAQKEMIKRQRGW